MSILVDKNTRVLCQGLGKAGTFHAIQCRDYGTQMVGGVVPGKGGTTKEGFPLFNTVAEAVAQDRRQRHHDLRAAAGRRRRHHGSGRRRHRASSSPSPRAFRSSTWPGPCASSRTSRCRLIGPNCPGVITPGQCKIGIMPGYIHKPGPVGVISRSGTLTYEAVWQLTNLGLGQSTCVGIGGDPDHRHVIRSTLLKLFQDDPQTEAILMMGEIGGTAEEKAAEYVKQHVKKPVAAFIAGQTAPPGKRMGHAGAIISGGSGTAADKITALRDAGIAVADSPADLGVTVQKAMKGKK